MTFRPSCMSDDELGAWREAHYRLIVSRWGRPDTPPCVDCPASFAAAMRAQDRCNGQPVLEMGGRPRAASAGYVLDRERARKRNAEAQRRYRARQRALMQQAGL